MRTPFLLLALTACAWAQPKTIADRARSVADLALAAPPELAADVLIKLAAIPDAGSREQKIEWLERAFALAPGAKFPLRLTGAAGTSGQTDSSVGAISVALGAGLDTLSLRARVVQAMLPMDRERAMGLFRAMGGLNVPDYTCSDGMVAQPQAYYETVASAYQSGFTDQEKMEGRDVELLRSTIAAMRSPLELQHAAKLYLLHPDTTLWNAFVGALERMRVDDRSYSSGARVTTEVFRTLKTDAATRGIAPQSLLEPARAYLMRHLSGPRCADTQTTRVLQEGRLAQVSLADRERDQFNALVEGTDVRPIQPGEVKPARTEGTAKEVMWWTSATSQTMLMPLKHLRFGTEAQQAANSQLPRRADGRANFLTAEQRRTSEWESEVRDYLKELERWRSEHVEGEAEFFHMSAVNYEVLTELVPSQYLRAVVLRSYVTFLGQAGMRRTSPPEWFTHANRLVQYPPAETEAEKTWIREEVRASGDPALAVYLDLWEITPRK